MIERVRQLGGAALRRFLNLVPSRRRRTTISSIRPAEDPIEGDQPLRLHDAPAAPKSPEPTIATTLNPATLLKDSDALPGIMAEARLFAESYVPGAMSETFGDIARMFVELFADYRRGAANLLESALRAFKDQETPKVIDASDATEELKAKLEPLVEKRLDAIDSLYEKTSKAAAALRRLTIGITGNPATLPVVTEIGFAALLPIIAAIAVSMYFEVVFNAPILQNQGNWNMAIAFSVLVSFAGSLTTFFAGHSMRVQLNHRNAETEKHSCFPDGVDSETKKPAEVFPMSGDAQFKRRMWHGVMAFVITGTLVIRYIMMSQLGDIAGSFGVILVFVVLYGWEAIYAETTHPRAAECLAKKAEAEAAEAELTSLKGDISSPEAKKVFDSYTENLARRETAERAKADTCRQSKNTFIRIAGEFLASPTWFTEHFREAIEEVVEEIGDVKTETDDEISVMTQDAKPDFSTDLPFDLRAEMQAAEAATVKVEITGTKLTAAQFDSLMRTINTELIRDRAAARAAAAEEAAKRAAEKPAPTAKPRPRWRAPRLT